MTVTGERLPPAALLFGTASRRPGVGGKSHSQVSLPPNARFTVWSLRPCHLGISACHKCPRLGPLPSPENVWSNISGLCFQKHGDYNKAQSVQIVGKRIVIRLRQELDTGAAVCEEARAVVPPPQRRARRPKGG
jgi:hypothetical protein